MTKNKKQKEPYLNTQEKHKTKTNDYAKTQTRNNITGLRPVGGGRMALGMGSIEKAKSFKKTWRQIISYSKPYLLPIIIGLVMVLLAGALQVAGPSFMGLLTNTIKDGIGNDVGIDLTKVAFFGFCVLGIYGGFFILRLIESLIMAKYTQKVSQKMRTDMSTKINKLPLKYFFDISYGDLLSRITDDVDNIGQTLNQSIDSLLIATTMFLGCLIMMLITNWILALVAIATSIVGFLTMTIILKVSQKFFIAQQAELGTINGFVEEAYTGHMVVKSYAAHDIAKTQFEQINKKIYDSAHKSQFFSGIMLPFMNLLGNLGYIGVSIVGAILFINDKVDIGTIVAFLLYVRLFSNPLGQFAQAANALQGTAASAERVFEVLNATEQINESNKPKQLPRPIHGTVEFINVKFGYAVDKLVIKDFSQKITQGQKVAIVGATGAGKTTIINLLMRFYELNSGTILIDGVDISTVARECVHDLFDMVLQDSWLFEGSIKDNIVYAKHGITDMQVSNACELVGLDSFVRTLPHGIHTQLNENLTMSEGQKQLLTIARAIIKDSPLLILDEATSSVDTRTEKLVQSAMDKLTQGRTSFVIAHRLSTIKNADIILVLKDGDIVEKGNHEDLMKKNGSYAAMYNSQFL